MRIWQSGAEAQNTIELGAISGGSMAWGMNTSNHTGTGSAASFSLAGTATAGYVAGQTNFLTTSFSTALYYKADVNITTLPSTANTLAFIPLRVTGSDTGGRADIIQVRIYNDTGTLKAQIKTYNGGTSSTVSLSPGLSTWFRVEVKVDLTPANGSKVVELMIDGSSVLTYNTISLGTINVNYVLSGLGFSVQNAVGSGQTVAIYTDNISINNTSGSYNTSWIGEETIMAVLPNGAGDSNPTAGTYASINEMPATTTATSSANRIEIDNPSDYAWFTLASSGLDNTDHQINAVSVPVLVRENSAGVSSYNVGIKSESAGREYYANGLYYPDLAYPSIGGMEAGDTTVRISPNGTVNKAFLISETDPTTNIVWKPTGTTSLTNAQIGMRKVTGTPNIWATWAAAMVAYSPKAPVSNRGMLRMFW